VALVFNEDNYYLTCYSSRHDSTSNYRVDRMDAVEIIQEDCSPKAMALRDEVASYTEQAFKMFGGRVEDVVLEFDRTLIGVVYDRFGESVKMIPSGEKKCIATVKVRISPVFWGWLFQFAGEMRIISPVNLQEEYRQRGEKLL
jgi:predicted DNA-binding transcriptional regulator YafY